MKILLTTDTFYPMVNGVVISTSNLYKQLKSMGHDVRILTLSDTREEKIDGDIYCLKSFGIRIYPGARVKRPFSSKLIDEIIRWSPDIIHSQTEFSAMLISKKIVRNTGIPHVHTYHTMYEDYLKYLWKGRLLSREMTGRLTGILLNTLDAVIAPTEKVEEYLRGCGVVKDIHIIPTGIDTARFRKRLSVIERNKLLKQYKLENKKVLVYAGRLAEEKNIEEIIIYCSKLIEEDRNLSLLIVGGGPYLDHLKELACSLGLKDEIAFTGMVPSDEIYKYYQLGNAFVTASKSETQGLTYIEALASGIPVICKNDPCVQNLILDGINGFKYNNEREFTDSVKTIFSDNRLSEYMSQNALMKADEYSSEVFGQRISEVYTEVIFKVKALKDDRLINL